MRARGSPSSAGRLVEERAQPRRDLGDRALALDRALDQAPAGGAVGVRHREQRDHARVVAGAPEGVVVAIVIELEQAEGREGRVELAARGGLVKTGARLAP